MSIVLVSSGSAQSGDGSDITNGANQDTTGATILIVAVGDYKGAGSSRSLVTDSRSNIWTPGTAQFGNDGTARVCLHWAVNPSVGANHKFNTTNAAAPVYPALVAISLSGVATTSPLDGQAAGSDVVGTTSQPGSQTPSAAGAVLVTALAANSADTSSTINGGFSSVLQIGPLGGGSVYIGLSYLIQGAAAAANPTWTGSASTDRPTVMAAFLASVGGGGGGVGLTHIEGPIRGWSRGWR